LPAEDTSESPGLARRASDAGALLPPGQQLAAEAKWPIVGERLPAPSNQPWQLRLSGQVENPLTLSLDDLRSLPQIERTVDIHCVTRWSKLAMRFGGVELSALLARANPKSTARFVSFVARSERGHSTSLSLRDALRLGTLLALTWDGAPLPVEHGGPLRTIVPGRYFYKSVKWLRTIELLAEDRLGYWEAEAGYHNVADPWRQQRYVAPAVSKGQAAAIVAKRDLAGLALRGLDLRGHALPGLKAAAAILRDARFDACDLRGADFQLANLCNARFRRADLRGAKFNGAGLEGVDFAGADLRQADLSGASLLAASFFDPRAGLGATIDQTTSLDLAGLDDLMPDEQEYVRRQLSPAAP
jgi:DMSO/TMAO reductase YedYZ molybdopterin-dependent catalytic subunit